MPIALITGASGGLGKEIALALLKDSNEVIGIFNTNNISIEGFENSLHTLKADIRNKADVKNIANYVSEKFGKLDYLINSAGVSRDGLIVNYPESSWDEVIAVNLTGVFYLIREVVPFLKKSDNPHIINISSRSAIRGTAGQCAYSASKAALIGLSASLAKELSEYSIKINTVLPGFLNTAMGRHNESALKRAETESALGTLSSPKEAAMFIATIIKTTTVTGQIFTLDSRL
ncbi:SDR family oxidoreductase [Candidatus Magnetomonas plexicatena]|uniref:SDR family oxidoreductase n=1 Tax=Candidatus Magnetomonas plexicatena TaxID=2552947 RepID=UPI0011033D41|nr:SDR family oxidoreductase [Nitrospirales bacterium LBB_01]